MHSLFINVYSNPYQTTLRHIHDGLSLCMHCSYNSYSIWTRAHIFWYLHTERVMCSSFENLKSFKSYAGIVSSQNIKQKCVSQQSFFHFRCITSNLWLQLTAPSILIHSDSLPIFISYTKSPIDVFQVLSDVNRSALGKLLICFKWRVFYCLCLPFWDRYTTSYLGINLSQCSYVRIGCFD